jgi:hypothetical protein
VLDARNTSASLRRGAPRTGLASERVRAAASTVRPSDGSARARKRSATRTRTIEASSEADGVKPAATRANTRRARRIFGSRS